MLVIHWNSIPHMLLTVIASTAAYALWRYYQYCQTVIARIPGPKPSTLLLGNLVELQTSAGQESASMAWFKTYGDISRIKGFLGRDILHVVDPKAVSYILAQGYTFEKDFAEKPRIAAMFGQGLLSSVGDTHRRLRRIMAPAFAWPQIVPLATIFQKAANDVKDRWLDQIKMTADGATDVNMGLDCSLGFLNALGEAAFGYDFDAFKPGHISPLFGAMMYIESIYNQRTYKQIFIESLVDRLPVWVLNIIFKLPFASGKPLKQQVDVMKTVEHELYDLGLQDAQSDAVSSRNDLLSVLIKANLSASPRYQLARDEVEAQLMTFVTAGLGTVLSVHCQLMRQLALHEDVQATLRASLQTLGDNPSVEQIERAEYLDIVIREALRMTDFAPLERIAQKEAVLPLSKPIRLTDGTLVDSIPIAKGQTLLVPQTAVSKNPAIYGQDADVFNPNRWLGEKGEQLRNYHGLGPGSWNGMISFGGGERSCIGYRFGLLELKIFVHLFVTTFKFKKGATEWTPRTELLERHVL